MMLQPKRMKFRKYHKNIQAKKKCNRSSLTFGQYGIKALKNGYFPAKTLEAMRQTLNRKLKKTGKLWVRIFPDIPRSRKPAEVLMGKGKGAVSFWDYVVLIIGNYLRLFELKSSKRRSAVFRKNLKMLIFMRLKKRFLHKIRTFLF